MARILARPTEALKWISRKAETLERAGATSAQKLQDLRSRDGDLIQNWYIACLKSELSSKKPLGRMIYETPLVLYLKSDGTPVCMHDRCLHRHAQLSEGDIFDDQIGCPYHGWVYDESGSVVSVPSAGDSQCETTRCLRLKTFPCVIQDDCVWVWMGDGPPRTEKPPYIFPYYKAPGWQSYFMVTDFDNEVTSLVENFMDVPHTVFVHSGWFRNKSQKKVPIRVDTMDSEVLVTYLQKDDQIGFTSRILNPKKEPMFHTDRFIMPNITRVDYRFGEYGFVISSQCTPVSTLKTRVYTEITYTLGLPSLLLKPFLKFYTRKVIQQDVEIMANQGRSFRINPAIEFNNTDADVLHVAIEHLRDLATRSEHPDFSFLGTEMKDIWI